MADVALWSGATGTGDGSSWANAYTTLQAVLTAQGVQPTRIFVASDHSELVSANLTFPAVAAALYQLISCDRTSGFPPTVEQSGASIGSTNSTNLTLQNSFYSKGVFWRAGDNSAGTRNLAIDCSASNNLVRIVGGGIDLKNTGAGSRVVFGTVATSRNTRFIFENAEIRFGSAGQGFNIQQAAISIKDGALAGSAITEFIKAISSVAANVEVTGVDMSSAAASMNLVVSGSQGNGQIKFDKCKMPASWTGSVMATPPAQGALRVTAVNVDSASTNYRMQAVGFNGSMRQETTIVRTGGATDGATPVSWRMETGLQYYPLTSFESLPIEVWNATVGSPITVTAQVLTDGVTLTDADAWIEVGYFDQSGNPLGAIVSDEKPNQLAASADQASSSESWTTTGITTPIKQQLSVTFTPQKAGTIRAVVKLARSNTVMYVCPKVL